MMSMRLSLLRLGLSALDDGALLSYKYDPEGEFFYVDDLNSWQQQFGFNRCTISQQASP